MTYSPNQPYNELPLLPPEFNGEDGELSKSILQASRSLAELKGLCASLPDPQILIQALVVQESRDSSAIENIVTTQDELYEALSSNDGSEGAAKEVLQYREALYAGLSHMQKRENLITVNTMVEIVQCIKGNEAGIRQQPGTVLKNNAGEVVYTPPCCEDVLREKLSNLENYINTDLADDPDPLIKMAFIHYQFEAIHPFADGNGRAGRILNSLYLVQKDLLTMPVLYLSAYINSYKSEYYRLLREVTEQGNWKSWCLFLLNAIHETSKLTIDKINSIRNLMQELQPKVKKVLGSSYDPALFEIMFTQPYLKIELLERHGIAHRETLSKYLNKLEKAGILRKYKKGKTNYFVNYGLVGVFGGN